MVAYAQGIAEPRLSPDGREVAYVTTVNRRAALVGGAGRTAGRRRCSPSDLVPRGQGGYGGGAFAWVADGRCPGGGRGRRPVAGAAPRRSGPAAHRATARGAGRRTRGGARRAPASPTRCDLRDVAVVSLAGDGAWPVRLSGGADFAADPAWSCDGARGAVADVGRARRCPGTRAAIVARGRRDGTGAIELVHGAPDSQSLQVQPSPVDPATIGVAHRWTRRDG